jgi:hypothetical protein
MAVDDAPATQLDALRTILASARDLAIRLTGDPLLERLLRLFEKIPEADREPILRVLERDATWCRIVEQTADTTRIRVQPNPHASLYLHVFSQGDEEPPGPLRRDVEVIRFGIEGFVHLLPLFFQEGVHEQWTASARELVREVDPQLAAYAARLAREVLALIADAGLDPEPQAG